jgi:hypothetical protein
VVQKTGADQRATGREFLNLKVVQKTGADQEYLSTVGLAA